MLLCDDLGYGDLGCFVNPYIHTPHLDQLARDGVKFTDGYSSSASGDREIVHFWRF